MPDETDPADRLERLARQGQPGLGSEFLAFLRDNRKWWLLPILVVIAAFGLLIGLASTGLAPFIYTMF